MGDLENKQVDTIWGCQYGSCSKDKWQLSLRWSLHKSTLCNPTALLMIHHCPTHGHSSLDDLLFGWLQCTPYGPVLKDHSEALAGPEYNIVVCIVIGVFGFSYAISLFHELRWLPVGFRVQPKVLVITYKALCCTGIGYIWGSLSMITSMYLIHLSGWACFSPNT